MHFSNVNISMNMIWFSLLKYCIMYIPEKLLIYWDWLVLMFLLMTTVTTDPAMLTWCHTVTVPMSFVTLVVTHNSSLDFAFLPKNKWYLGSNSNPYLFINTYKLLLLIWTTHTTIWTFNTRKLELVFTGNKEQI